MLKKILISALITSHFYHHTNCSDTEPTQRIVYTDVISVQTQATQTDPINFTEFLLNHPKFNLPAEINTQWHARTITIRELMQTFTTNHQKKLLALAEIHSLHGLPDQNIATLSAHQQRNAELEANLQALATTDEVLLGLLLGKIFNHKEHKCEKALRKAAKEQTPK